jgi:hypothetical protein
MLHYISREFAFADKNNIHLLKSKITTVTIIGTRLAHHLIPAGTPLYALSLQWPIMLDPSFGDTCCPLDLCSYKAQPFKSEVVRIPPFGTTHGAGRPW